VVETAYFHAPPEGRAAPAEAPLSMLIPTWALIAANLYFGVDTELTLGVAGKAAAYLIGGAP
jgi:multicomponent Na+:H+ antiporter subunit D